MHPLPTDASKGLFLKICDVAPFFLSSWGIRCMVVGLPGMAVCDPMPCDTPSSPTEETEDTPPWETTASADVPVAPASMPQPSSGKPAAPTTVPNTKAPSEPLTEAETARFKELDQLIYRHSVGYLMVADALKEINAHSLYRTNYKSFDEYCLTRHGFGRQQGQNLVQAATLLERLKPHLEEKSINVPVTEGIIRELRRVKDDEQCAQAYVEAVQKAGGDEKVTPKDVRAMVKTMLTPPRDPSETPPPRKTSRKERVREQLGQLREALKAGKSPEELEVLLEAFVSCLDL